MKASALRRACPGPATPPDDPFYARRRRAIAALAAGPAQPPVDIDYLPDEHQTWVAVYRALAHGWAQHAHRDLRTAWQSLDLPPERVPQLREVSERLSILTGFTYRAVPGLVDKLDFFHGLADGVFLSTQYVRHPANPLYTEEPDVIHEVLGHATCLADSSLAQLHRSAGAAMDRVELPRSRQFIADVFWFSGEFGVVDDGTRPVAFGAGLLSSPGELAWFGNHAQLRPIDIAAMGTQPYAIDHYQPVLFAGRSLNQTVGTVVDFFDTADDDRIDALRTEAMHARTAR